MAVDPYGLGVANERGVAASLAIVVYYLASRIVKTGKVYGQSKGVS